jgi:hypothetical protein
MMMMNLRGLRRRYKKPTRLPSEHWRFVAGRKYRQSSAEWAKYPLVRRVRTQRFSVNSHWASVQHNRNKSAYWSTVYRAGVVIDKRCGHVAWLDVASCEWKRGSSCKRNDQSNTGLPKRVSTRGRRRRLLIHCGRHGTRSL